MTLTDRAEGMLAVNRALNPECEHIPGDMRMLRLDRQFDVVLVHDAIMYATEPGDVLATLRTAAFHCRPGGTVAVLPDCVRETFAPATEEGGARSGSSGLLRPASTPRAISIPGVATSSSPRPRNSSRLVGDT